MLDEDQVASHMRRVTNRKLRPDSHNAASDTQTDPVRQWLDNSQHGVSQEPRINPNRKQSLLPQETSSDNSIMQQEFVHHAGFHGSQDYESQNLKYKFGKRKPNSAGETFKNGHFNPKGFGSIYDAIEFERRYKKVFDNNQHVHFVHSNFLSGKRIFKRTRLPPIGHIAHSVSSDPGEPRDIFAIMSVQKFNHPEHETRHNVSARDKSSKYSSPSPRTGRRGPEVAQEVSVPVGFVPGTITKTGQSPFEGVRGEHPPSTWGQGTHSVVPHKPSSDRASTTPPSSSEQQRPRPLKTINVPTSSQNIPGYAPSHTLQLIHEQSVDGVSSRLRSTPDPDPEPFNISVHVEIKQKNQGDDDEESYDSANDQDSDKLSSVSGEFERHVKNYTNDKIVFPISGKLYERISDDNGHATIDVTHVETTHDDDGSPRQRVRYPPKFQISESLAEEDLSESVDSQRAQAKITC